MNRRGFLQAILASGVAPYVCTAAGVLMPVKKLVVPALEFGTWESFRWIETEALDFLRQAADPLFGLDPIKFVSVVVDA